MANDNQDAKRQWYPCQVNQTIVVNQVVGQNETQKSMDIHIEIPRRKPAIEQIIDVFVNRVRITCVEVLRNKVIVRGFYEIKALYVACRPNQPVHAIEAENIHFTAEVDIYGARCGMDADADVEVEYVDYSCDKRSRPYWYKAYCQNKCRNNMDCSYGNCHKCNYISSRKKRKCTRHFDVTVVLKISAKVLTDREILVVPAIPVMPKHPKG